MPDFGEASNEELNTCDERLQRLFRSVVKTIDCKVLQGKRSEADAAKNRDTGTSHTNHSKHVYPVGESSLAADVAPYPVDWSALPRFYAFGGFVKGVAREMDIAIRWGGDWDGDWTFTDQRFNDLVHFELL